MAPLQPLVRLKVEQISYSARDGRPVRLTWQFEPIVVLTEAQVRTVEEVVRRVFRQVFGNFMGGLLSEADATLVFDTIVVAAAPTPVPSPPPQPRQPSFLPPQPGQASQGSLGGGGSASGQMATAPVLRLGITWYYGWCGCYGGLIPAYTYYYSYEPSFRAAGGSSSISLSPSMMVPSRGCDAGQDWARQVMLERLKDAKDPAALYWTARTRYWQDDYSAALALLMRATGLDALDARDWYFRALAERALGYEQAAKTSALRVAAVKLLHQADEVQIGLALERIQGAERRFLSAADSAMSLEITRQIVPAPLPRPLVPR